MTLCILEIRPIDSQLFDYCSDGSQLEVLIRFDYCGESVSSIRRRVVKGIAFRHKLGEKG